MTDEYSDWLDEITSFNLNARYDDYKREFVTIQHPQGEKNNCCKLLIFNEMY